MDKTPGEIAAGFGQDVDLAETGLPMFITIAGREIVIMDAVAFRAMQSKASERDWQRALVQREHDQWEQMKREENTNAD